MKRRISFTKMHGAGNDYVYVNALDEAIVFEQREIERMSARHFGIGADGVVLILPSEIADFRMQMFNSDGSEAEMCGNAIRCVAKYVYDKGISDKRAISIETKAGVKELELEVSHGCVTGVRVDMGTPILDAAEIPVKWPTERVVGAEYSVAGRVLEMTCVSMGNPHAVFFVEEISDDLVSGLGPEIEVADEFPSRTNVEFAKVLSESEIEMRVWERGAGETLACGTGASAVVVASVLRGLTKRCVYVSLPGGRLEIEWTNDDRVYMKGPASFVYEGWIEI